LKSCQEGEDKLNKLYGYYLRNFEEVRHQSLASLGSWFSFSRRMEYAILIRSLVLPEYAEGGESNLEGIIYSFILSTLASILAYYICKWLDKQNKRH